MTWADLIIFCLVTFILGYLFPVYPRRPRRRAADTDPDARVAPTTATQATQNRASGDES